MITRSNIGKLSDISLKKCFVQFTESYYTQSKSKFSTWFPL